MIKEERERFSVTVRENLREDADEMCVCVCVFVRVCLRVYTRARMNEFFPSSRRRTQMHDAKMTRIFFYFDIIHAFLSQLLTTK